MYIAYILAIIPMHFNFQLYCYFAHIICTATAKVIESQSVMWMSQGKHKILLYTLFSALSDACIQNSKFFPSSLLSKTNNASKAFWDQKHLTRLYK